MSAIHCGTQYCTITRWLKIASIGGPILGSVVTAGMIAGWMDTPARNSDVARLTGDMVKVQGQLADIHGAMSQLDRSITVITTMLAFPKPPPSPAAVAAKSDRWRPVVVPGVE